MHIVNKSFDMSVNGSNEISFLDMFQENIEALIKKCSHVFIIEMEDPKELYLLFGKEGLKIKKKNNNIYYITLPKKYLPIGKYILVKQAKQFYKII